MLRQDFLGPGGPAQELRVEVTSSLEEVGREAWEELDGWGNLYCSYPYLLAVERSSPTPTVYVLLREAGGRLVAGLPGYLYSGGRDPGLDHYEPFRAGANWVLGPKLQERPWRPTWLAGSRSGYVTTFPIHPDWSSERLAVTALLLQASGALADASAATSLMVPWLTSAAAAQALPALRRPEHLVLAGPSCSIELGADGMEGYLSRLSSSRRKAARQERKRFLESGLEVQSADLASCLAELAPLAARLQRRYGHRFTEREITTQLHAQAEQLNPESLVLLCRRRGRIAGFSLLFQWGDTLYGRLAGFDYRATAGTAAYFNLCFHLPLELAADRGLRRLHLGMASWRAKVLRGADFDPAWQLICPPRPVRGAWARAARAGDQEAARWWAGQFPRLVDLEQDLRWTRAGLRRAATDPSLGQQT